MLDRRQRVALVLDPERHEPSGQPPDRVVHERVVAVRHHHAIRPQGLAGRAPQPGDVVDLAVAIQLIPEQVREDHHPRREVRDHPRDRGLVDLEDADVSGRPPEEVGVLHQRRGDAGGQVGAGAIVHRDAAERFHDVRQQSGGRGFSVRAGDDHAPVPEAPGEEREDARLHGPRDAARHRGPPSPMQAPAQGRGRLPECDGRAEAHADFIPSSWRARTPRVRPALYPFRPLLSPIMLG